jgi:hypothetical protein
MGAFELRGIVVPEPSCIALLVLGAWRLTSRRPQRSRRLTRAVERTSVRVTPAALPPSPAQPSRHSLPSLTFGVRRMGARSQ